jgi:5-bromo-4-chloroindolyl phosphate hydrolysis protein
LIRLYAILALIVVGGYIIWKQFKKKQISYRRKKMIYNLKEASEELETIKIVTLKLVEKEEELQNTDLKYALAGVLEIQLDILKLYNESPTTLTDLARRWIINYSNSLLNILEKWQTLQGKHVEQSVEDDSVSTIQTLISKWEATLQSIRNKITEKQFEQLDAEIQSMINGLNLDN